MLLKKPVATRGDIVGFVLSSGQELVAEFIEDVVEECTILIHKCVMLQITNRGIGFVNYPLSANQESNIKLNKSLLVCGPYMVPDELKSAYIEATTGIQIAANVKI